MELKPIDILSKYYGYSSFRKGQENIINSIIDNKDVLAIMPTGGGKSICYQVPALCLDGITIVISPLISLMKDQVDALKTMGVKARLINSSLSNSEYNEALEEIENDECKIDSLPQSWSVISGAAKKSRALEAMMSVDRYLLNEEKGIILLLAPPFNNSKLEPGYIKGYVPGVRENGGQYTHAATWVILAWTLLGDGNKAWKYYNMINPINHSSNKISANNYKIEPYVMAADIYLREPHGGRGGWSWYTGASGWMYKVGLENILGLKRIQNKGYKITPCVPDSWNEYEINIKDDVGEYHIVVKRKNNNIENKDRSKIEIILNNNLLDDDIIPKTPGKNEIKVFF